MSTTTRGKTLRARAASPKSSPAAPSVRARPSKAAGEVLRMALRLSRENQERVAFELLESLHFGPPGNPKEVEKAWNKEIKRRIEDLDSGKAKTIPAEEVFRELRARRRKKA